MRATSSLHLRFLLYSLLISDHLESKENPKETDSRTGQNGKNEKTLTEARHNRMTETAVKTIVLTKEGRVEVTKLEELRGRKESK